MLVAPAAKLAFVQVTVPPDPAFGVLHDHVGPGVCWKETKVMSAGSVSFNAALEAASGPSLVTWMVKVTLVSASA